MAAVARETFYKQFRGFLRDLIRVFPEDREIRVISSTLNIAVLDDSEEKIIRGYYEAMEPYADLVRARDPSLFYKNLESFTRRWKLDLFGKMSQYWERLDDGNKSVMWDYIDVLFRLSELVQKA